MKKWQSLNIFFHPHHVYWVYCTIEVDENNSLQSTLAYIFVHNFASTGPIFKIQLLSDSEEHCASFWHKNKTFAKAGIARNHKNLAPQKMVYSTTKQKPKHKQISLQYHRLHDIIMFTCSSTVIVWKHCLGPVWGWKAESSIPALKKITKYLYNFRSCIP